MSFPLLPRSAHNLLLVSALVFFNVRIVRADTDPVLQESNIISLHDMVASGKVDDARGLLKDHPELLEMQMPAEKVEDQLTPLNTAADSGKLETAQLLLSLGAKVDNRSNGTTPLMRAAIKGHDDIVKLLLKSGADVNGGVDGSDLADVTPIRAAQLYGRVATAQLLLEKGARVDFFSAAGLGWKDFVADRLEQDPTLATRKDNWGFEAVWLAVNTGHASVVDELVSDGASVDGQYGQAKFTAMHVAAERGYIELAAWLLNHGYTVNSIDNQGRTPLAYASLNSQDAMVSWLKQHGAN